MDIVGGASNFLFGTQDWKNAWEHASHGNWGQAAKDAAWGTLALGSTVAMAVPLAGEGIKGAAVAAQAARAATAGRAVKGAEGARTAYLAREATTSVRPSVQAYAQSSGRDFLADSFGVGQRTGVPRTRTTFTSDHTPYGFPDGVAEGSSPVATLTRPKIERPITIPQPRPVGPGSPKWVPREPGYVPEGPAPLPKEFPGREFKPTAPAEAPTLPDTVAPGPGTTLMPKDKLITEEGAATETQLQGQRSPNARPVPVGVIAPAGDSQTPNKAPEKPEKKRRKGPNDSLSLYVQGQDITQQVVH